MLDYKSDFYIFKKFLYQKKKKKSKMFIIYDILNASPCLNKYISIYINDEIRN